ncbi:AraC family transcriptional regulator [Streptomyces roseofulvus]|uniref:helix-turn-helix transcriptional regulator n=1 Tax=Streptomyces roseofulvus TaxID=33902 RepID=UPI0031F8B8CC
MEERWNGSVVLEAGRLRFRGRLGTTHAHAHAAVQLVIVRSGTVELADRYGGRLAVSAAVIPSRATHSLHAEDAQGTVVYYDSDSRSGRALRSRFPCAPGDRVTDWVSAAGAGWSPDAPAGGRTAAAPHPAVGRAVDRVRSRLHGPVSLEEVATALHLSPSRLGHLFAEELGLPFPAYVRWARIRRAIELVRAGATLTQAACGAGFCDSSHLTRVVHEMFGMAPSQLLRDVRWEPSPQRIRPSGPGRAGAP